MLRSLGVIHRGPACHGQTGLGGTRKSGSLLCGLLTPVLSGQHGGVGGLSHLAGQRHFGAALASQLAGETSLW